MPFQIDEESPQHDEGETKKPKLAEALQRLFYNLQVSKERFLFFFSIA